MMPRSKRRSAQERGFSLVETVIAMAIFALALGQVAAAIRTDGQALAASAADIAGLIEGAGRNARLDGAPRLARVSEMHVTILRGADAEQTFKLAAGQRATASQPIRLDADGGTTGGGILLKGDDQTYAILISRFDGATRIERRRDARR